MPHREARPDHNQTYPVGFSPAVVARGELRNVRQPEKTRPQDVEDTFGSANVHFPDNRKRPMWSAEEIAFAIERNEVTLPMMIRTVYVQWSAHEDYLRDRYRQL